MVRLFLLVLLPAAAALGTDARGQTSPGEELALALRNHVVSIRATWSSDTVHDGFGFVVGERGSDVYIVTADHLVRGHTPDEVAELVELTWFSRRGEQFPATLLGTRDDDRDVAVLRATLPQGIELNPDLMIRPPADARRSDAVWYVGKAREWYVPSVPGRVNTVDLDDQIIVDGLNVQVGTSGAPLVSDKGIAGMIVEDSIGGALRATSIDFIQRAFSYWAHPWAIRPAPEERPDAPDEPRSAASDRPGNATAESPAATADAAPPLGGRASPPSSEPAIDRFPTEALQSEQDPAGPPRSVTPAAEPPSADEPVVAARPPASGPPPEPAPVEPQGLEAELQRRLAPITASSEMAAQNPFDAETGLPQITLQNLSTETTSRDQVFASFDAALGDIDFGRMTARVEADAGLEKMSVSVTRPRATVELPIADCVFRLAQRDFSLVWRESLGAFTGADIAFGPSRIICANEITTFSSARLHAEFDPDAAGSRWSGTLDVTAEDVLVRTCEDAGCGMEGSAAFDEAADGWWQLFGARTVAVSLRFRGADLAERQAALAGKPILHWPREASFLAFPIDLLDADSPEAVRRVSDYLGDVDLAVRLRGVTAQALLPDIELSFEHAELKALSGRPAIVSYRHEGAALSGPAGSVDVPPVLTFHVETTGRLDLGLLAAAADGSALLGIGPFTFEASAEREPSRVHASGQLWLEDQDPADFALRGVVEAVEPGALLMDVVSFATGGFDTLGADEEAFAAALQDTLAAVAARGSGSSDPEVETFELVMESATEFASVNGVRQDEVQRIFEEACIRRGC